ncbi:MAG: Tim44 domain-containing protein [Proteobacteria bacterium]|nr:Tim44 domain-containing protein [Pseudomonadota bacterium]
MKTLLSSLIFVCAALIGSGVAYADGQSAGGRIGAPAAQTAPAAEPVDPVAIDANASGSGSSLWVMIGGGVVIVLLGIAIVKVLRSDGGAYRDDFANYEVGYETINPNTRATQEAQEAQDTRPRSERRPAADMTTRARTDTIIVPPDIPADFDVARFLRKAKAYFMRLQASWDKADVRDIRQFTKREIFGEFCTQINARGDAPNTTEVVTLGAELLGVETMAELHSATIKFTGMIKDAPDAQIAPFSEVWVMVKPTDGTRSWAISSIQQY